VTLTFTAANWATPQTVTVTGVDDAQVDGDVAYTIITTASSADAISARPGAPVRQYASARRPRARPG
jgi:hypothetical protein